MKLFDVVSFEATLNITKETFVKSLGIESIKLIDSLNKYLAKYMVSEANVPHFRKSTVDSYAVLFDYIISVSELNPVKIKLA